MSKVSKKTKKGESATSELAKQFINEILDKLETTETAEAANDDTTDNLQKSPKPEEKVEESTTEDQPVDTNEWELKYFRAGSLADFPLKGHTSMFPVQIPDARKRVNLIRTEAGFLCTQNVCPHQGAPLHKGIARATPDLEDLSLTCVLHGWQFNVKSGTCNSNRFVLDCFDVKIVDEIVWIAKTPNNADIQGNRRDFMGNELVYNPSLGWI